MPDFRIFGILAAILFAIAVFLGLRRKFKYHRYFALAAVLMMLVHIAGAFELY